MSRHSERYSGAYSPQNSARTTISEPAPRATGWVDPETGQIAAAAGSPIRKRDPRAEREYQSLRRMRSLRGRLMAWYFVSIPIAIKGFGALTTNAEKAISLLGGYGLIVLGTHLLREGVKAAYEFHRRALAAPPRFPRKFFGALTLGGGVLLAAGGADSFAPVVALALGGATTVLALIAVGLDPLRRKGAAPVAGVDAEQWREAIIEAEGHVDAMDMAASQMRHRALAEKLGLVVAAARRVIGAVADDPDKLRNARKYLRIYLASARSAIDKFVAQPHFAENVELRAKLAAMLDDMLATSAAQLETLMLSDQRGLEVEIEVLAERLKTEGA